MLTPTVFHEPWWLSCASDGQYKEAVIWSDSTMVAFLPYVPRRKANFYLSLGMPQLPSYLGPAFQQRGGGRASSLINVFTDDLLHLLPPCSHINFRLSRKNESVFAFHRAGFSVGIDFTVEFQPSTDMEIFARMRTNTRYLIRRCKENLSIRESTNAENFMQFYNRNLRSNNKKSIYDTLVCVSTINEAISKSKGCIKIAEDKFGEPHAAIFTIFDAHSEYYIFSTRRPDSEAGAVALLLHSAIIGASKKGRLFDTAGIDSTNYTFLTGLGGEIVPRYTVERQTGAYRLARKISHISIGSHAKKTQK